ncbi:MAG: DUF3310 domain-containing protein [Eubacteriales bacterium]|nr:DUF3310 domain-containing protein [Eubacteriales bacterium]
MSKLCKKFGPFPCDPVKDGEQCDGFNPLCVEYDPQGEKTDAVNHPEHYTTGGIECIDAIRASLGNEDFASYCKGNVMKYIWRYRHKGGVEDLKKARVYLNWMIEAEEGT